jgi:hypothetical protein
MEESHYRSFGREPFGQGIGPFAPRGEPTGVVVRGGYVIAQWGEPDRVDMTHSVTKSFLSATVGLAVDRGLIPSVRDTVWKSQAPVYALRLSAPSEPGTSMGHDMFLQPFATPHNRTIIWDDLLRQTSARAPARRREVRTNTMTCGSTCWPWRRPTSGGAPCPKSCVTT